MAQEINADISFSAVLRRLRLAAGLSQEALAERARISVDAVSALERGARKAPQRETLELLKAALGLAENDLKALETAATSARSLRVRAPRPESPALRIPNNLPQTITSFHGRDESRRELEGLLRTRRLITLAGAAGVGKTRLALEAARRALEGTQFEDGVWFIELALVTDPSLVAQNVAQVLRVETSSQNGILDALAGALRDRRALIVLDNCEHVLDAAAELVERIVQRAPSVVVLATTREPLRVDGELLYPVDPLPVPSTETALAWQDVRAWPGVALFVDRAHDVSPRAFGEAPQASLERLARVCRRLDGIPFALELAAARMHELTLEEIESGLDERFALLGTGRRTAIPRQRTLQASLDWSYALLDARHAKILRTAGIFAASWSAHAAITIGEDCTEDDLELLAARSLLIRRRAGGEVRYGLLDSVRHYARERLKAAGEEAAVARRHAVYYRDWVAAQTPELSHQRTITLILPEIAEIRAALDWALEGRNDLALGLEFAALTSDFWYGGALAAEGLARLESAMAALADDTPPHVAVAIIFNAGRMRRDFRLPDGLAIFERAHAIYEDIGDEVGLARAADGLATAHRFNGTLDAALHFALEAVRRYREIGEPTGIGLALMHLGVVKLDLGEYDETRALYEQSLELFRSIGNQRLVGVAFNNLAWVHTRGIGDQEKALEYARAGLQTELENDRGETAHTYGIVGEILYRLRRFGEARQHVLEAIKIARRTHSRYFLQVNLANLGLISSAIGDPQKAARLLGYVNVVLPEFRTFGGDSTRVTELTALVNELLEPRDAARYLAQGAAMNEAEIVAEALAD